MGGGVHVNSLLPAPWACQTPPCRGTSLFQTQPAASAGAAPCLSSPTPRKHTWPLLQLPPFPTSANLSALPAKYKQNQPPLSTAALVARPPAPLPPALSAVPLDPPTPREGPSPTSRDSSGRCPCLLRASTPRSLSSEGLCSKVTSVSHLLTSRSPPRVPPQLLTLCPLDLLLTALSVGLSIPRGLHPSAQNST